MVDIKQCFCGFWLLHKAIHFMFIDWSLQYKLKQYSQLTHKLLFFQQIKFKVSFSISFFLSHFSFKNNILIKFSFIWTILSSISGFTFKLHDLGDCLPRGVAQPRTLVVPSYTADRGRISAISQRLRYHINVRAPSSIQTWVFSTATVFQNCWWLKPLGHHYC